MTVEEAATRGTTAAARLREELRLQGPVTMQAAAALLLERFASVDVHEFALTDDGGNPLRGCGFIVARPSRGPLLSLSKNEAAEERASTVIALLGTLAAGLVSEIGDTKEEIEERFAATAAAQQAFTVAFLGHEGEAPVG